MASKLPVSVLTLLGICILLSVKVNGRRMLSKEEDMELERQLNILNKPPIQTFEVCHILCFNIFLLMLDFRVYLMHKG
ncbi:hypothetical protein QJS04_geneDACA023107 [Acorus gramineus]|uniref:Uncharacterized protein n=1 Tax=Acorus gramineus TaxID=55184 RepID=A0AAV9A0Q4_ACOGR|nr:hypothetical protein QJS04_geneDACA023107 [Acorus gramineus]